MNLPVLQFLSPRLSALPPGPQSIAAVRVLRISVTDRCNFRCVYCMPADGVPWIPQQRLLTAEQIAEVALAAVEVHGIRRFKITGGEPTVRADLLRIVRLLSGLRGVRDVSLTTNGALLSDLARPLRDAGCDRVTISIDSLRPDRFRRITRSGDLPMVLRGMEAAESAGFGSLKVNFVVMRGINDDEVADLARLSLARRLTVRFIEYMPLGESAVGPDNGCDAQDRGDVFVPESEVRSRIESVLGPLEAVERRSESGVGPANVFRLAGAAGRVGFISAMSAPFCSTCNRLRLTATGVLRSCLFDGGEVDLEPILRAKRPAANRLTAIAQAMTDCVALKPTLHANRGADQMSRIGG